MVSGSRTRALLLWTALHVAQGCAGQGTRPVPSSDGDGPMGRPPRSGAGAGAGPALRGPFDPGGGSAGAGAVGLRLELLRKVKVDPSGVAGSVDGVAFSRDGRLMAAGDLHAEARLYRTESGELLRKVTHHPGLFGKPGELNAIGFSPDGRHFFTGIDGQGCKVWRTDDGQLVKHLNAGKTTDGADISPDGRWIATGANGSIAIYDLGDFRPVATILHAPGASEVNSLHFSADGALLASAAGDGTVKLIATRDWQVLRTIRVGSSVKSVRLSPDGALVAYGARGKRSGVHRVEDGAEVARLVHTGNTRPLPGDDDDTDPAVEAVAWTEKGDHLLTSGLTDGLMHLWRRSDWRLVSRVQAQETNRGLEYVDVRGPLVAAGGDEGVVYLFRLLPGTGGSAGGR